MKLTKKINIYNINIVIVMCVYLGVCVCLYLLLNEAFSANCAYDALSASELNYQFHRHIYTIYVCTVICL